MNITIDKKALVSLLQRAAVAVDAKSALPMLSCLKLETFGKDLEVSSTDLYRSASAKSPCEVKDGGSLCVEAGKLIERARAMSDGPVVLDASKPNTLELRSPSSRRRFTLDTLKAEDFPKLPLVGEASFSLPEAKLAELLDSVSFAVSTDETRAHVNSLLLVVNDGEIVAVATDGHRLAKSELTADVKPIKGETLIPLRAAQAIRKSLGATLDTADVAITKSHVFITVGDCTVGTKLVEAQFPPWQQVIPKPQEKHIAAVPRLALIDAIKAVSSVGGVAVKLGFLKDSIEVTSSAAGNGDGRDSVDCDYGGPAVATAAAPRYFLDALGSMSTETVLVQVTGELDPIVFREAEGEARLSVVMPMRV